VGGPHLLGCFQPSTDSKWAASHFDFLSGLSWARTWLLRIRYRQSTGSKAEHRQQSRCNVKAEPKIQPAIKYYSRLLFPKLDGSCAVLFLKIARIIFWPTFFAAKITSLRRDERFNTRKNHKNQVSTGSNTRRCVRAKSVSIPFCEFSNAHTPNQMGSTLQGAGRKSPTNFNRILDQRD
jgi:hypothetical protein